LGWFEGMLSGFAGRKGEREAENLRSAELASAREGRVYEALLSSPDPEIQSMAAAGLLESAKPGKRKGGFKGWLGEMEQNPYLPQIQQLIGTPVNVQETGLQAQTPQQRAQEVEQGVPTRPPGDMIATPPGGSPLAQATTSPTQGAPLTQVQPRPTLPTAGQPALGQPTTVSRTVQRPRQVFATPEDVATQGARGKARGDVEGEVAGLVSSGFTEVEARQLVKQQYERRHGGAAGASYNEGNVLPDPNSPTGYSQILYLRADPKIQQRIPAQPPTAASLGVYAERAARELGFVNAAAAGTAGADAMKRVNERAMQIQAETGAGTVTARGTAAADVPLSTSQRFTATTGLIDDWRKAEAPIREMQRQSQLMETGLSRFKAGDKIGGSQAVLVTFQKILDPTSVVRESEYARSGQGLGLVQRIEGMYERLKSGGAGVPEAELAQMVETGRQFLKGMEGWNATERQRITTLSQTYGIDPNLIFGGSAGAQVGTPPPGATAGAPAGAAGASQARSKLDSVVPGKWTVGPDGSWIKQP